LRPLPKIVHVPYPLATGLGEQLASVHGPAAEGPCLNMVEESVFESPVNEAEAVICVWLSIIAEFAPTVNAHVMPALALVE